MEKKNGDQTWEGMLNMLTISASDIPCLDRKITQVTWYKQRTKVNQHKNKLKGQLYITNSINIYWSSTFPQELQYNQYLFNQVSFIATLFVVILQSLQNFFKQLINTKKFQLKRNIAIITSILFNVLI